MEHCTYAEDGIRYLVPFDAINFYVGRGKHAKKATVTLKDIVCDGICILFLYGQDTSQSVKRNYLNQLRYEEDIEEQLGTLQEQC